MRPDISSMYRADGECACVSDMMPGVLDESARSADELIDKSPPHPTIHNWPIVQ